MLYGLDPEPAASICARFGREHGHLERADPEAFRSAVAALVADTAALMRASADAAISFGPEVLRERMQRVTQQPIPAFVALIRRALRAGSGRDAADVERAIRRSVGAALMERDFTQDELAAHFRALLT